MNELNKQNIAAKQNEQIFNNIITNINADDFIEFYKTHNRATTREKYGIRTDKQLVKILTAFNYDFSFKKSLNKGKPAQRSHESYVEGGKKSKITQKQHWDSKSDLEKAEWSSKMAESHNTDKFKVKIKEINKNYWENLSKEEKEEINRKKSKSGKEFWAKLSKEEQLEGMTSRFKSGRSYNCKNSTPNQAFADTLTENKIEFEREFCLDMKKFDFKIGNILVEINPTATHNIDWSPFNDGRGIDKLYHKEKSKLALKYGYRCLHIFDWENKNKIVECLLKNNDRHIYGRNCEIKEIARNVAKEFINTYHIQNYAKSSIFLGLFNKGELISVMTFGKPRYNKRVEYELVRYCSKYNVGGGAEKLFKYFVAKYSPASVVSYCDFSKFTGETYLKLGFELKQDPAPSIHWTRLNSDIHITHNLLLQQGYDRLFNTNYGPGTSNEELMLKNGFVRVYDCGQATYIWENKDALS